MKRIRQACVIVGTVGTLVSMAAAQFELSFEPPTYVPGALKGQDGWTDFGGRPDANEVSGAQAHSGTQSLHMVPRVNHNTRAIDGLTGTDVDLVFWMYRIDDGPMGPADAASSSGLSLNVGGEGIGGQPANDNFSNTVILRPDDPSGDNFVAIDFTEPAPQFGDTGIPAPVGEWTRVRIRFLWDDDEQWYDKYEAHFGPADSEFPIVTLDDNLSAFAPDNRVQTLDHLVVTSTTLFDVPSGPFLDDVSVSLVREIFQGDFDRDGDVDFTDFSVLAGNFTGTLEPGIGGFEPDEGDIDGDEDVDFADFSIFAANFTGTIAAPRAAVASIPEPATLCLIAAGVFVAAARRRSLSTTT